MKRFALIVCLVPLLFACGGNIVKPAYDSAVVSKTAYDVTLTAMNDLYKQGFISEAVKVKAIEYGNMYKIAHNGMVEALAKYVEAGGDADRKAYLAAASEAARTLLELLNFCTPYITKGGKP